MKRTVILFLLYVLYLLVAHGQEAADSTVMLNDVVVKSYAPKTKLRGDAIVTKIAGSALEKMGSVYEMLGKVPGMIMRGEELEVIGKGAPVFYVNGRKIFDIEELKRLRSEDILEVEVINNPGAQYDATVRSVVRIRTRKPAGEGLGFDATASHSQDLRQADFADPAATVNMNYRHKGLDVFGMANHWNSHTLQYATADQHIYTMNGKKLNDNWQHGWGDTRSSMHGMNYAIGTNWMANENHSMGIRFQIDHLLSSKSPLLLYEELHNNGAFYKTVMSETHSATTAPLGYNLNTYYNGRCGKFGIDWNFDWNRKGATEDMNSESDKVSSSNHASSELFATKLLVSHPVKNGAITAGTEMIWVRRDIDYTINQDYIADSQSNTHEDTYSAFVEYAADFGRYGMLKAGTRFESVKFNYANLINADANVNDVRNGLFPSLSYRVSVNGLNLALNYSTKTVRPNFYHLNDATTYASHSILMQGNSQLRNQILYELGINAQWKWITGSINYTKDDHMISQWQYPYVGDKVPVEEGVVVYRRINLPEPVRTLITYINASPTFSFYSMNWTAGYQQQFLRLELTDPREASGTRVKSYNDPIFFVAANNTFRLPRNWQLECNIDLNSPGNVKNYRLMTWNAGLSASIQKSFLSNKALTMRLTANDILYRTNQDILLDSGDSEMRQLNRLSTQRLKLSVHYRFNQTKSMYKGTGAGKDVKERM